MEHKADPPGEDLPLPVTEDILAKGRQCLLNMVGHHFLVKIIEVQDDAVVVSFPGKSYPVEGMIADLEFHDETGYYFYTTYVLAGPTSRASGIVLQKPNELRRSTHRDACRVPTDLTAQVKEQYHASYYDADLINLSASGALIQTEAPFDFSSSIEMVISLPGEPACTLEGQIVHVAEAPPWRKYPSHVYGVRFEEPDPDIELCLSRYIWSQLQELFPRA
jgi:Tfp pilus assembly protein PilZ